MDEGTPAADGDSPQQPAAGLGNSSSASFHVIALAGEARSLAMRAVGAARDADFALAESLLGQAERRQQQCHAEQSAAIAALARGERVPVDILAVHAQDHLSMATMAIENTRVFLDLYRRLATRPDHTNTTLED